MYKHKECTDSIFSAQFNRLKDHTTSTLRQFKAEPEVFLRNSQSESETYDGNEPDQYCTLNALTHLEWYPEIYMTK